MRNLGRRIYSVMLANSISFEYISSRTGFTPMEFSRILDGTLCIPLSKMKEIARELSVDLGVLVDKNALCKSYIHTEGVYKDLGNIDKILDYIDLYVDLEEMF